MSKSTNQKIAYIIGIAAIAIAALTPSLAPAQEEQAGLDLGKYRIDIAGRQRMLIQRMAKSVCFIELGQDVETHQEMLASDFQLFDASLIELRDGGGQHDIPTETDRRILAGLETVTELWTPFAAEVEAVGANNAVSDSASALVSETNLAVLKNMNDTVSLIQQEYANPHTLDMAKAVTLNIIARQRMLSQKMAKDFCYIATGNRPDERRAALAETQALFAASLGALINGYEALGIAPPPTDEISTQLGLVAEIWEPVNATITRLAEGAKPTSDEISLMATENMRLLVEMNKAVQMYVAQ